MPPTNATTNTPPPPPSTNMSNEEALKAQQDRADYMFRLQIMQQSQNEEQATRTNMAKSSHDAMMAIANNLKA